MANDRSVDPLTGNPPVNYTKTLLADLLLYGGALCQFIALEPDTFLGMFPHPPKWLSGLVMLIGVCWKLGAKAQAAAAQKKGG